MMRSGGLSIAFGTVLLCALYAARVARSGETVFGFLLFNLALAWIPWLLAQGTRICARRGRPKVAWAFAVGWLLFLPNAPYLVTDFVHLRARDGTPLWYDVALLGTAALTGLVAGALSLETMRAWIAQRHGRHAGLALVALSALLCGVGIYLGRFERWSSWDIVLRPSSVVHDLIAIAARPHAIVASGVFAAITLLAYLAVGDRRSAFDDA